MSFATVQAIVNNKCMACHSPGGSASYKRFDNLSSTDDYINSGLVVKGKPEESTLVKSIASDVVFNQAARVFQP